MEERFENIRPINNVAEEYKNNHKVNSYWLEGEFIEESIPLDEVFKAGAEYVLKCFEEELNWHTSPELGYFCDCLEEIIMKLKGEEE